DLKEQLLPALHEAGRPVRVVQLTDRVLRIRDRLGYLEAAVAAEAAVPASRGGANLRSARPLHRRTPSLAAAGGRALRRNLLPARALPAWPSSAWASNPLPQPGLGDQMRAGATGHGWLLDGLVALGSPQRTAPRRSPRAVEAAPPWTKQRRAVPGASS